MTDTAPMLLASRPHAPHDHPAWGCAPAAPPRPLACVRARAPGTPLDRDLGADNPSLQRPSQLDHTPTPSTDPELRPFTPSWPAPNQRPSPPAVAHQASQTAAHQPSAPSSLWPLNDSLRPNASTELPMAGRDFDLEAAYLARMAYPTAPEYSTNSAAPPALRSDRSASLTQAHPFAPAHTVSGPTLLAGQHSPPSARSQFVQPSPPKMWNGVPPSAAALASLQPPSQQRYDGLDPMLMYDDPARVHPLNSDLTRQLDAASGLPPPTSPWQKVPTSQYPPPGVFTSMMHSPTLPAQEQYAYELALERARAVQAALAAPQWPAGDSSRNRNYTGFSSGAASPSTPGSVPNASDLLAARLGQVNISGQADARRHMANQATATNTAPAQSLEALRASNELLAAALRATPAQGGSMAGGTAPGGANWSAVRQGPAPIWPSDASSPLDHTIPPAVRESPYESKGAAQALAALLPDLLPREEKFPAARSHRPPEHGPNPSGQRKAELYKTELCRKWSEKGSCRYGAKCQFAHGTHELRPVERHHLYKTQVCRTFASTGVCPYSYRCCFIHPEPPPTAAIQEAGKSFPATVHEQAPAQGKVAAGSDSTPHTGERQRQRSGSKSNRTYARRISRNSSSLSAAGATASASAAVNRLHEAMQQARTHPRSASVPAPEQPGSPRQSPTQPRPRARSHQSQQSEQGSQAGSYGSSESHHLVRPALNPLKEACALASGSTMGSSSSGSLGSWTSGSAAPTVPTAPNSPTENK